MRITAFVKAAIALAVWGGVSGVVGAVTCDVSPVTSINVPRYSAAELSSISAQYGLNVACTANTGDLLGTSVNLLIGISSGSSPTNAVRTMIGPNGARLEYNLYTSPSATIPWGDTANSSLAVTVGPINAARVPFRPPKEPQISLVIRAGQWSIPAGLYTDTLTVTLTF
jgi:spore coat protein U-like protein